MTDPTDLPTLKARLRELLERATPMPWKVGRHGGEIVAASLPRDPQVALACGQAAMHDDRSSTPEVQRANAELIAAAVNALPTLLDALDATERAPATTVTTDEVRELRRLLSEYRAAESALSQTGSIAAVRSVRFYFDSAASHLQAAVVQHLPALLDLAEGAAGHVTEEQLRESLERAWDGGNDAWDSRGMDDEIEERRGIDVAMLLAELNPRSPWRPITQPPTEAEHAWCGGRYLFEGENGHTVRVDLPRDSIEQVADYMAKMSTWLLRWLPIPPSDERRG